MRQLYSHTPPFFLRFVRFRESVTLFHFFMISGLVGCWYLQFGVLVTGNSPLSPLGNGVEKGGLKYESLLGSVSTRVRGYKRRPTLGEPATRLEKLRQASFVLTTSRALLFVAETADYGC